MSRLQDVTHQIAIITGIGRANYYLYIIRQQKKLIIALFAFSKNRCFPGVCLLVLNMFFTCSCELLNSYKPLKSNVFPLSRRLEIEKIVL